MKPIFTILDTVADFYSPLFQAENNDHAIRMFESSIDLDHKADFSLWRIGQYDQDKGNLSSVEHTLVAHGKNLKSKEKTQ